MIFYNTKASIAGRTSAIDPTSTYLQRHFGRTDESATFKLLCATRTSAEPDVWPIAPKHCKRQHAEMRSAELIFIFINKLGENNQLTHALSCRREISMPSNNAIGSVFIRVVRLRLLPSTPSSILQSNHGHHKPDPTLKSPLGLGCSDLFWKPHLLAQLYGRVSYIYLFELISLHYAGCLLI